MAKIAITVRAEQVGYVGSASPQSSKGNRASRSGSSRDGILALEPDQVIDSSVGTSASVYETPEHSTRGVETLRVSNTPDTAQYGTALDEVLSEEDFDTDVTVNAVDRAGLRPRFSSQGRPPARQARPPNDIDICYQCFRLGNRVPTCPCRDAAADDPHFNAQCKERFDSLSPAQKKYLVNVGRSPRWLYAGTIKSGPSYVAPPTGAHDAPMTPHRTKSVAFANPPEGSKN